MKFTSSIKKLILRTVCILIITTICFITGALWSNRSNNEPVLTTDLISSRLSEISELATVKYLYTNMGKFEETNDFYGWKVPFTKKEFIISYDGEVKAGINIKDMSVAIVDKEILITLPKAQILSHTIKDDSIQVFDETKNIFNQISITDYTRFSSDQKTKIEQKAIENGLLIEADEKAKSAVLSILKITPELEESYTIKFKTK